MSIYFGDALSRSWGFFIKIFDDISKLLILIALSLVPVINLIVFGYGADIIRRGEEVDEPPPLEDLGRLFIDGLKILLIIFIYTIPLIILYTIILSRIIPARVWFTIQELIFAPWVVWVTLFYIGLFFFPILILIYMFAAMAIIHSIKTDSLSRAFAFGEIWSLIMDVGLSNYILWALVMVIGGLIVFSSSWLIQAILTPIYVIIFSRSAYYIYPSR